MRALVLERRGELALRDIDLPDEPITIGEGAYAAQALANFRTHVLGVDNRPQ